MTQKQQEFIKTINLFAEYAFKLSAMWEDLDDDGNEVTAHNYPFTESFESISRNIAEWSAVVSEKLNNLPRLYQLGNEAHSYYEPRTTFEALIKANIDDPEVFNADTMEAILALEVGQSIMAFGPHGNNIKRIR